MLSNHTSLLISALLVTNVVSLQILPQMSCAAGLAKTSTGVAEAGKLDLLNSGSTLLVAGIQYSEELPKASETWYWIPDWFAGTWRRDAVTTTSTYDCRTGQETKITVQEKAMSIDEEGWQRDNRGDTWNCQHTPFRSESDCGGEKQVFVVSTMKPLEITEDKVVKQFEGKGYVIDAATGKVKYSANATSVETYRKVGDGVMMASSVTTELSKEGEPVCAVKSITTYRQTAGFHARNFHDGKDMRISFKDFLHDQGKSELFPTAISSLPDDSVALATGY